MPKDETTSAGKLARTDEERVRDTLTSILLERETKYRRRDAKRGRWTQRNVWASSVPMDELGCWRELFYRMLDSRRSEPLRPTFPPNLLIRFAEGNRVEDATVAELTELSTSNDWSIEGGQKRFALEHNGRTYLSGKVDFMLRIPGLPKPVPTDVKNYHPSMVENVRGPLDVLQNRFMAKGALQILFYAYANDYPLAILWLASLGGWKPIVFDLEQHWELLGKADAAALDTMQRIWSIDACFDDDVVEEYTSLDKLAERARVEPPAFCGRASECRSCWARDVYCRPEIDHGDGATIITDDVFESEIKRYRELAETAREYLAIEKRIKNKLPEAEHVLVGRFHVSRKEIKVKGQKARPATSGYSYWKTTSIDDLDEKGE